MGDVNNPTEQAAWVPSCPHVTGPVCLDSCFGSKAGRPGTSPTQLNLQGPHSGEKAGTGLHHSRTSNGHVAFAQSGLAHPPSSKPTLGEPRQPWPRPARNPQTHSYNKPPVRLTPLGAPSEADLDDGSQACDMEASPASWWLPQQHTKRSLAAWGSACKLAFPGTPAKPPWTPKTWPLTQSPQLDSNTYHSL